MKGVSVPDTELSTLHTGTLRGGGGTNVTHFTDEETEVHRGDLSEVPKLVRVKP